MLERFVSVVAGMAVPFLLVAVCAVVLSLGTARDRSPRARRRLIAAGAGSLGGVVFAVLRATAVLGSRTAVTLPTLAACVLADLALLAALVLVVRRATPRRLDAANAVACVAIALAFFRAGPDVILQLTSFIEPGESVLSSAMLLRVLGFVLGFVAVAVIAFLYRRAAARAPGRVAGWAGVAFVALVLLLHLTSLVQLLHAARRIQLSGAPFRVLVWLVNSQNLLVIAACAVLLVPLVVAAAATLHARPRLDNPAQERLAQASTTYTRRSVLASAAGFALVALTLSAGVRSLDTKVTLSEPEPYTVRGGRAVIPLTSVEDGHLHRYAYTAADGAPMRFIVVRKSGGAYGVALDACESCGPGGYYEKSGKIICKACDVAINLATIGFRGGCNPIPLDFQLAAGAIEIETATLDSLSSVFA